MFEVYINEAELEYIDLIRAALSSDCAAERQSLIFDAKHDALMQRLDWLEQKFGAHWVDDPKNLQLALWLGKTSNERQEAAFRFAEFSRRHDGVLAKKLMVAEHIGSKIFSSIKDKKFLGVQSKLGILQEISDEAKKAKTRGVKDLDTLRKIWSTYRGVVHLGMAIDYCAENPDQKFHVIQLAEFFRNLLSTECPRGTDQPYVDPKNQVTFRYVSMTSGPRFQDRGLPFYVM